MRQNMACPPGQQKSGHCRKVAVNGGSTIPTTITVHANACK